MPSRYSIDSVLTGCDRIARVWTDNPTFTLGEVTLPGLQAQIAEARAAREQLDALRMQMTALSNQLDEKTTALAAVRTRALSGLRATFGPNSTQYEQGGGTRQSERRKATRKSGKGPKDIGHVSWSGFRLKVRQEHNCGAGLVPARRFLKL